MYFRKYPLPKTWLDQCLKSGVSGNPKTENMGNRSKQGSNLNDSNCIKVINHFEGICIGKSLF